VARIPSSGFSLLTLLITNGEFSRCPTGYSYEKDEPPPPRKKKKIIQVDTDPAQQYAGKFENDDTTTRFTSSRLESEPSYASAASRLLWNDWAVPT